MVVAVAVALDRQPMPGPAAVDVPAVRTAVHLGLGKAGDPELIEEGGLELAQGQRDFAPENAPELAGPRPVVAPGEDRFDRTRVTTPWLEGAIAAVR